MNLLESENVIKKGSYALFFNLQYMGNFFSQKTKNFARKRIDFFFQMFKATAILKEDLNWH